MNQICCLNPECNNPSVPPNTKFCPSCGVPLVKLRHRYQPVKPLGGGGFAKTYLAVDIDKLNEKCVIKQFAPQTQGTAGLQKATALFLQEAQQLQQLGEHPQIPALSAYFAENSRLYLVQQFIDGENLFRELEQQGRFSESKIRALLEDLLSVLKVVHSHNIIHRDIKPENIMRRGSDRKLILIDFGASKQLQGTVKTGTTIGTFGYSALEQMQDAKVYPASDLYSIGATCFHLLTGVHPWKLWREDGYGWVKSWRNHLQQPISPELGQILDKLLQKDVEQRYQSAEQVLINLKGSQIPPTVINPHPQVPQPQQQTIPSKQPSLMQLGGLFVGGFVLVLVGQSILTSNLRPEATAKPEPKLIEKGELTSSVGMDYTKLQNLLAAGRWKEADEETERVMLAVANREKERSLDTKNIENFPCQDLNTINQLWVESSDGRFGFSVQKRIYQSLGGTSDVNMQIWLAFGDRVGWRKAGEWLTSNHSQLTFDTTASQGHLPALVLVRLPGFWGPTSFMSKLADCKI